MGVDYGFFIREQAIKNLLSAQRKMAAKGNAKGLIAVLRKKQELKMESQQEIRQKSR